MPRFFMVRVAIIAAPYTVPEAQYGVVITSIANYRDTRVPAVGTASGGIGRPKHY